MPVYVYRHPKTKKCIEVVQKMNDKHEYMDEAGVIYERVFLSPRTSVDTQIDAFSQSDFMRATNKNMTIGDMMDESSRLSEVRAKKAGRDPLKQKLFDNYKKSTGKNHPEDKPKKIETPHFEIEL